MKLRKLFIGAVLAVSFVGVSVNASAKAEPKVITIKKESQYKKGYKKALACFKADKPFKFKGEYKFEKRARLGIEKYLKKQHNIKSLPSFKYVNTKAKIKKYKNCVKYMGLICKDIRECYDYALSRKDVKARYRRPATQEELDEISAERGYTVTYAAIPYYDYVYKNMSDDEILARVLSCYFDYTMKYKVSQDAFYLSDPEKIYRGTYKGDCGRSSQAVMEIVEALGFETRFFVNEKENHGWACMKIKDITGKTYWKGISGTAGSCDMELNGKKEYKSDPSIKQTGTGLDDGTDAYIKNLCKSHR